MLRNQMRRELLALALLGTCACSKQADPAPAASSLAVSSAAPSANAWHFVIDPKSTTQVDMLGVSEHIKGDTTAAKGTLDVLPTSLVQSRGSIQIDLSTFATHTFGNDKDATQTEHARTWLEVVVNGQTNETNRWATLAIRSIDGASAPDVTKVAPTHDGGDDVRTVSMTVHGDVLIHGHKLVKDVPVDVAFHYPTGAPADSKPTRIEIKNSKPMNVVLEEVDVEPRDTVGKLTSWTTNLVGKVAKFADVTVDLNATPTPSPP
jgi:hypothetical protein